MTTILLISGSTRSGSTNSAVLATVAALAPDGVRTLRYGGMTALPHFNPDDDHDPLPPAVAELRSAIGAADAVLFCTLEYAGSLPGSFKNLLDWTVGSGEIYGKPVAWINASWGATGAAGAHAALRTVLGYVGALIVDQACAAVAVGRPDVDGAGLVADREKRQQITAAVETLVQATRTKS